MAVRVTSCHWFHAVTVWLSHVSLNVINSRARPVYSVAVIRGRPSVVRDIVVLKLILFVYFSFVTLWHRSNVFPPFVPFLSLTVTLVLTLMVPYG